jgi:hypothetical protein
MGNTMDNRQRPVKGRRSVRRRASQKKMLIAGWIFLGVMLPAAVAAIILLLPGRSDADEDDTVHSVPQLSSGTGGSAFQTDQTAAPIETGDTGTGRLVAIGKIDCGYTPPETVTVGVLQTIDLLSVGETVAANVAANGWGSITCSLSDNGSLLLQNANQTQLTPENYEKQEAFLASSQPEAAARTFLEHSNLIAILREYGLELSTEAENNNGEITFRGTGSTAQSECSVRFSFLYTGDFNQAVIRAVALTGAVDVQPRAVKKAASDAVTWDSAAGETATVTAVELRSVRGLPFYVFTCADGTTAYSLAVDESVLDSVSGAREIYEQMMTDGLREYVETSGTE